jgi:hypothetical protein
VYPVFERLSDPLPRRDEDKEPDSGENLAWSEPEPLVGATRPSRPGLLLIERLIGGRWMPVYLGMSATGAGQALRWIVQAPAILGLQPAWNEFRARIAEAGFDTTDAAGRATLRRLRDETAAAFARGGTQVLVGPGPAAPSAVRNAGDGRPTLSAGAPE